MLETKYFLIFGNGITFQNLRYHTQPFNLCVTAYNLIYYKIKEKYHKELLYVNLVYL